MSVYNSKEWDKIEERIRKLVEEKREEYIIIGRHFNVRIAEDRNDTEGWDVKRKNKDKTMNNRGREFVELVGNIGGYIPNGTITGDEEGEFMYVGPKCSSVIDYMVNENCKKIVKNFRIVERVDSNHMPLEIEEDGGRREATRKKEGDNKVRRNAR